MPDIIILGSAEKILALEPEENPAESFPCMPCAAIDKTVRSQLYAYLAGIFYDDAQAMEVLVGESGPGGPFIYRLDEALVTRLAETDEDRVPEIVKWWSGGAEMDALGFYDEDPGEMLSAFLFDLIYLCLRAHPEPELDICIYTEGSNFRYTGTA